MSWTERLRAWWCGGQMADRPAGEQEIDEELMFHLRSLVGDNLARGMPADTAWQEAQRRFGSLRRYAEACRNGTSGRLVKRIVPAACLLAFGVFFGCLVIDSQQNRELQKAIRRVQNLQRETALAIDEMRAKQPETAAEPNDERQQTKQAAGELHDLTGRVLDRAGGPLANATLLVILKTWPGGWYRQEPFATTSDAEGRFCLPNLIPSKGQFAIQLTAFRSGYGFASSYQLQEGAGPHTFEPITLRMADALPITLVVQDCNGRSVARARVVPASRQSAGGERQLVYFQGSEPIHVAADSAGRVGLECFAPGDEAEILVQLPGRDWEQHQIHIPQDAETVTISARAAADDAPDPGPDNPSRSSS
jgi:hypothetical protein